MVKFWPISKWKILWDSGPVLVFGIRIRIKQNKHKTLIQGSRLIWIRTGSGSYIRISIDPELILDQDPRIETKMDHNMIMIIYQDQPWSWVNPGSKNHNYEIKFINNIDHCQNNKNPTWKKQRTKWKSYYLNEKDGTKIKKKSTKKNFYLMGN